jgi:lipopolysaccharide/colanic/teichoic acid biosynthesis glycosyltransferase
MPESSTPTDITPHREGRLQARTRARSSVGLVIKRATDVVVSAFGLLLVSPLLAAIGLAIRIDSPGPITFTQLRVAQDRRRANAGPPTGGERRTRPAFGPTFKMYKFRTMRQDAPKYAESPVEREDARITRVGRFLRRTSHDELPQLLNVLRGDMSLVGPRPEMPFIVERYEPIHRRRLEVKPGLTGLWQLRGPRDRLIHEAINWDLYYVDNWSLRLDLAILFETLLFVVRARNH